MPITLVDTPDPLSERSFSMRPGDRTPLLIGSDAARLLTSELRDYCDGKIAGRSFLIAGHRGAGKSTLVANSFLQIWKAHQQGRVRRRPLFVSLNGPSLFLRPQATEPGTATTTPGTPATPAKPEAPATNAAGDVTPRSAPKPPAPSDKSEAQIVLEQIILGLHRAVTREFSAAYLEHVKGQKGKEPPSLVRSGFAELSAQFDAELMDCPEPARLSEFYRHAGLNQRGLFATNGHVASEFNAAAELLALSGISDAYKRISGEYAREDQLSDVLTQQRTRDLGKDDSIKALTSAMVPLLIGGAAGVGVGATTAGGIQAVIGGILAALGSAAVIKYSTKRTTTRSRVENFIFDLSLATLDRVLPVLIERLGRAGLAPMFVIDELDKVEDLAARMRDTVHHLKKLVAENAFFCFLADRKYFEEMLRHSSNRAYPLEYTYYSHRVFVVFQASDFASYLDARLAITEPTPRETALGPLGTQAGVTLPPGLAPSMRPSMTPPPGLGTLAPGSETSAPGLGTPAAAAATPPPEMGEPGQAQAANNDEDDTADNEKNNDVPASNVAAQQVREVFAQGRRDDDELVRDILMWVLRHRSQLHPLDLRRQLRNLTDENNTITVRAGDVLRTSYLVHATMQVVIEAILGFRHVMYKIADDYEYLRLVHDSLYYIARQAMKGETELAISDTEGLAAFKEYLDRRTSVPPPPKDKDKKEKNETSAADDVDALPAEPPRDPYDLPFLYGLVKTMAGALADGAVCATLIDEWQKPSDPARQPKQVLTGNVRSKLLLKDEETVLLLKEVEVDPSTGLVVLRRYIWRYDQAGRERPEAVMLTTARRQAKAQKEQEGAPGEAPAAAKEAPPATKEAPAPKKEVKPEEVAPARPEPSKAAKPEQPAAAGPSPAPGAAPAPGPAPAAGPPSATRPAPAAAPPPADSASAAVLAAFIELPWRETWDEIESFLRMLNDAIGMSASDQRLRYDSLARQFRLMPATPPWEEVEEAHKRLERGTYGDISQRVADVRLIEAFWGSVKSSIPVIVRGISIAASIGSGSLTLRPSERVLIGLDTLARALRVTTKTDDAVAQDLKATETQLTELFPRTFGKDGRFKLPLLKDRVLPPLEAIGKALAELVANVEKELGLTDAHWPELLTLAWNNAFQRLLALYGSNELAEPSIAELFCACRHEGPSQFVKFDPRQMTIADWTSALVATIVTPQKQEQIAKGEVPAWVGFAAMYALGFVTSDRRAVNNALRVMSGGAKLKVFPGLIETYRAGLVAADQAREGTLLVVRKPTSSVTTTWMPRPSQFMCIVATPAQMQVLREKEFPLKPFTGSDRRVIALEMSGDPENVTPDQEKVARQEPQLVRTIRTTWNLGEAKVAYLYARKPVSTKPLEPAVYDFDFEHIVARAYSQPAP